MTKRIRFKTLKGSVKKQALKDIRESPFETCYIDREYLVRRITHNIPAFISINTCRL